MSSPGKVISTLILAQICKGFSPFTHYSLLITDYSTPNFSVTGFCPSYCTMTKKIRSLEPDTLKV